MPEAPGRTQAAPSWSVPPADLGAIQSVHFLESREGHSAPELAWNFSNPPNPPGDTSRGLNRRGQRPRMTPEAKKSGATHQLERTEHQV